MTARDVIGNWLLERDIPLRAGESINTQADAILTALEAAGYKVLSREPTQDMRAAMVSALAEVLEPDADRLRNEGNKAWRTSHAFTVAKLTQFTQPLSTPPQPQRISHEVRALGEP